MNAVRASNRHAFRRQWANPAGHGRASVTNQSPAGLAVPDHYLSAKASLAPRATNAAANVRRIHASTRGREIT